MLLGDRRLDEALTDGINILEINPDAVPNVEIEISRILALQGRLEEAVAAALQLPKASTAIRRWRCWSTHPAECEDEADAALRLLKASRSSAATGRARAPRSWIPIRLAEIYAFRGRPNMAFSILSAKLDDFETTPERSNLHVVSPPRIAPCPVPEAVEHRSSVGGVSHR